LNFVIFCHSLISDWNHGNAHFLRGIVWDLRSKGHRVDVYEPRDGWSISNLLEQHGEEPVRDFHRTYPGVATYPYDAADLDLDRVLDDADVVLVHEWNDPDLVARIGLHHRTNPHYSLLFHDTHHRSVSDSASLSANVLEYYDGVLAFGEAVREQYLRHGWARNVWTWHEAADPRVFRPHPPADEPADLIWIGNWGDEERTRELEDYLFAPVRELALELRVHGVRYPQPVLDRFADEGVDYRGWIANFRVPGAFAGARATVHVPRGPYRKLLPGIPTIRPFEAMACGIPLVSAPWEDSEGLFREGRDFLMARNPDQMRHQLRLVLNDGAASAELSRNGRETILRRHTCGHRVDELFRILALLRGEHRAEEGVA
jgi:spore maturation protein CgeB